MRTALSMRRWRARKASEEGHGGARRRASALTGNRGKEKGGEVGGKLDGEAVRRSARAQRAEVPGDSADVGCEVGRPREAAMGAAVRRRRGKRRREARRKRAGTKQSFYLTSHVKMNCLLDAVCGRPNDAFTVC
jgi:hypothetical protein